MFSVLFAHGRAAKALGRLVLCALPFSVLLLAGPAARAASLYGGLEFDGADDYVTFGPIAKLGLPAFTLETWFKWTGVGIVSSSGGGGISAIPLVTKGRGESEAATYNANYFFGIQTNGLLAADFEEGPGGSQVGLNHPVRGRTPVTTGVWHHGAVSYDGTTWALYLDGVLETNLYVSQPPAYDSIQHAALGSALNSTGTPEGAFAGVLDEARIWNYARTAQQIADNYRLQIASAAGLVGRWSLDETAGLTAHDSTTNAVDGTLVNGPAWTTGYPFVTGPFVAITSPGNGGQFALPTNIVIDAAVSGFTNTVTNVAFYANTSRLGADPSSPYSFAWSNMATGSYALTAVAWDNTGFAATSAVVNISIVSNFPPTLTLSSPTNNASFAAPANLTLVATAADDWGVTRVEFYQGTTLLGQDTTSPYSLAWTAGQPGSYQLRAVAWDLFGLSATSSVANITVLSNALPIVAITNPPNGATFTTPVTIAVGAAASDPDGTVTNVEFYAGTSLLGQSATIPYGVSWPNPANGVYALTAVAVDNAGARATSAPVSVIVGHVAIPLGLTYTFDTLPPVSDWSTLSIGTGGGTYAADADLQAAVQAEAASAINLPLGQSATLPSSTYATARWNSAGLFLQTRPTGNGATLLMATLVNTSPRTLSVLEVTYDAGNSDSADEEINGPRCYFSLTGASGSWTPISEFSTSQTGPLSATLNLGAWPTGSRMYIVWADDNGNGMTDGSWTWDNFKAGGPAIRITSPANNALLGLPDNIVINAAVSGFGTTVTNVAFFIDGNKLGDDKTSPYSAVWSNAAPGQYVLTAIARDDTGLSITSSPVTIHTQSNAAPTVVITSPAEAAVVTAPADLPITVSASDTDGSVTNVAFFANGAKIGQDSLAPFSLDWSNVAAGTYDLSAVAWDNLGAGSHLQRSAGLRRRLHRPHGGFVCTRAGPGQQPDQRDRQFLGARGQG